MYISCCTPALRATRLHHGGCYKKKTPRNSINISWNKAAISGDCGLIVSTQHPWLAATPDGFVYNPDATPQNGLVEYKNPHACRNSTIEEAITSKQIKFLTLNNGILALKRSHQYYYQVQTAMLCTETKWCDFVVLNFELSNKFTLMKNFATHLSIKLGHFTSTASSLSSQRSTIQ